MNLRKWFATLSEEERCSAVSIVDKEFAKLLLNMFGKKNKEGDGLFFEVGSSDEILSFIDNKSSNTNNNRSRTNSGGTPYTKKNAIRPRKLSGGNSNMNSVNSNNTNSKRANATGNKLGVPSDITYYDDYFVGDLGRRKSPQEDNFCFRKKSHYWEGSFLTCIDADQMLEDAVRLCDTVEYLDTVTFSLAFLRDPAQFFRIMRISSRGNFIKEPSRVYWDQEKKSWSWEIPKWFESMGFYTLSTYIAHKIEMVLWSRYWAHSGLDPRKNPNTDKKYNVKSPTVHYQSLASKEHLRIFWRQLPVSDKKKLIGAIGNIIKEVVKEDEDCFSYPQLLSFLFEISAKSQESNAEASFIDFLYFSPLNRADTRLDFVVRRMGVLVQREYADKLSKDLLLGEQEENARKAEKKEKKKKQKKRMQKKGKEQKEQKEQEVREKEKQRLDLEKKKKQEEITKFVGTILNEVLDKVDATILERRRNKKKPEVRRQLSSSTSSIQEDNKIDQYDDWIDVSTKPDRSVRFVGYKTTKSKEAPETSKSSKKMAPDPKSKAKEAPPSIRISKKAASKHQDVKQPVPTVTPVNNNNNTTITVNNNNNAPKEKEKDTNIWKDIGKLIKSVASSGTVSHNQSSASSPKEKDKEGREKDTVNRSRSDPHLDRAVVRSVKFGESTFASANHSPRQSVEIGATKSRELESDYTIPRASSNKAARLSGNFTRSTAMNIEQPKKPQSGGSKQTQQEEQKYEAQYPPLGNTQKLQQLEEKLIAVQQEAERKQKREKKSIKRRQTSPSNYNQPKRPPSPPQHHPYHLIDFPSNYNYPYQSSSLNNSVTPGLYFRPPGPIYAQAQSPPYAFKVIPTGSPPKTNTNKSSEKSSMSSSPTGGSYVMTMDPSGYYPPNGQGPYYYLPEQYQMHIYQQQTPLWPQPWAPFYPAAVNKLFGLSDKDNQQVTTMHDQILRFQTLVDEMVAAKAVHYQSTIDRVTSLINGRWPDVKVEVFGSLSTGLSIPSSDLDLVVHGITAEIISDAHDSLARSPDAAGSPLSDPLKFVANMLRGQDWVKTETLQCIETASVPVIKFHTADHGIHVDISFHANVTNHSGAEARELLKYYCGMYKELKPLALVLKQFLHLRKLNNSYTGGLSSYCLVLMIVSFLQLYGSRAPAAADGSSKSLGALLLDFLELYGLKFEYEKLAISIAIGGGHIPIEHCQPMVSAPLIILDPFNPQNNIGFNSFEMWKVRRAFSFAYHSTTLQLNSLIQSLNQEDREDTAIIEQAKDFKVT